LAAVSTPSTAEAQLGCAVAKTKDKNGCKELEKQAEHEKRKQQQLSTIPSSLPQ